MNVNARSRNGTYLNGVLTVIAGLLAVLVTQSSVGLPGPEAAVAADRVSSVRTDITAREAQGIPNAADQRARMISSLNAMDARLARIESKLNAPLDVKVIDMPEMKTDTKKPE